MGKNVLPKIIFFSFLIVSAISCAIAPTYKRQDIEEVIKDICKEEYGIDVIVWDIVDTIWIYAPLNIIDEQGQWNIDTKGELNEKVSENIRKIRSTLTRVLLSIDKQPKFYCLVISDIEKIGVDWYMVVYLPDEIKLITEQYSFGHVSTETFRERVVSFPSYNLEALGDTQGRHVRKFNLTMGDFISLLITQNMRKILMIPEYRINDLRVDYYNKNFSILFNIEVKQPRENLPLPFDAAKKAAKKVLQMYDFKDVANVEVVDELNDTKRFYTLKALFEND